MIGLLSAAILFYFDWRLALFTIFIFPFVILGGSLFSKQAMEATRRNQVANAGLSMMIEEVATQHFLVQAFNLQGTFLRRFQHKLLEYRKDFIQGILLRGMVTRTSTFGLTLSEVLIFGLGAIMAYHGELTVGTLFGFFALVWNLSAAVDTMAQYSPVFIEAGASLERVQSLLEEKTEESSAVEDKRAKTPLPTLSQSIRFEHLFFQHEDGRVALKDVHLEIPVGTSVAFVGPTGSGKSTILSLLMGFYHPTSGDLLLDGKKIEEIAPSSLREQIGGVFQQSPLFNNTIRENIRMGLQTASDQEVEEAAKVAEIHDFIMTLPQGYDAQVLEYGSNFSVGQKQRLAIARAYLRHPRILLLDEPTSALDPVVEEQINALIAKLAKEKTVILATHRLNILLHIDQIYVLDKGEVVERGSHEELLKKKGRYEQLWRKQHRVTLPGVLTRPKIETSFLRHIPLLSELPDQTRSMLAEEFSIECVDAGQVIFDQGSVGDKFYIIARGTVEVCDTQRKPADSLLAVLEEGDYFGEIALLKDCLRTAQVRARSYCIFFVLHSFQFLKVVEADPTLKKKMAENGRVQNVHADHSRE
jgi:ATP-binding cassette subfamily B protein